MQCGVISGVEWNKSVSAGYFIRHIALIKKARMVVLPIRAFSGDSNDDLFHH
jgi:hypothetical protein